MLGDPSHDLLPTLLITLVVLFIFLIPGHHFFKGLAYALYALDVSRTALFVSHFQSASLLCPFLSKKPAAHVVVDGIPGMIVPSLYRLVLPFAPALAVHDITTSYATSQPRESFFC